jgi:glycerophosphoryl diester phosphodiesterase
MRSSALAVAYELVAHRGHALEFPENTLPSFESALQLGARWLELDVQLSKDQVPMVLHDATLERTTTGHGPVWELPAAELQQLAAGEPARFGARFASVRLSPLFDVLQLIRRWPGCRLCVEIKEESLQQFGHELVMRQVLQTVAGDAAQCIVISFDELAVQMAREQAGLTIGWVLHRYDEPSRQRAARLRPELLFCNHTKFPATRAPWPGPWRWAAYEVREPALAEQLAGRGVTLIETMAVGRMLERP